MKWICKRRVGSLLFPGLGLPDFVVVEKDRWQRLLFGRIEVCWMGWPWRWVQHPAFKKPKRLWSSSPDFAFKFAYVNIDYPCLHLGSFVVSWSNDDNWRAMLWDFGTWPKRDSEPVKV